MLASSPEACTIYFTNSLGRWHQFLIYIGYNLVAFLVNAFMTDALPIITKSAFIWSLVGFSVISITVLACASPEYSSAEFVFTEFLNEVSLLFFVLSCYIPLEREEAIELRNQFHIFMKMAPGTASNLSAPVYFIACTMLILHTKSRLVGLTE